jgi:alcohol dehydrogenase (cytochrome c)
MGSPVIATISGVRMLYIGDTNGLIVALNADSGQEIWSYLIDQIGACAVYHLGCTLASTPAVDHGTVYFGAGTGAVYALDAATGTLLWRTQLGDPNAGYEIYTSAAVYNGLVYVGVASQYDAPCVPGQVVALDAKTGAIVWNFNTIDQSTCPSLLSQWFVIEVERTPDRQRERHS